MIINLGDWNDHFMELIRDGKRDEVPSTDDYIRVVDVDLYKRSLDGMMFYRRDIIDWLENLESYVTLVGGVVKFQSPDAATMFKLTWGGQ